MKKIVSILLAITLLVIPVYGDDAYTQEQLVAKAKEICSIEDYPNFSVASKYAVNGIDRYKFSWEDDNGSRIIEAVIDSKGILYSYSNANADDYEKITKVYSDTEAKAIAESFLEKALGSQYSQIVFSNINAKGNTYAFSYNMTYDGIEVYEAPIKIYINKYTGLISSYTYSYYLDSLKINGFENTKTFDEAQQVMKDNYFKLGYTTYYDSKEDKYDIELLYVPEYYRLKAEDLTPMMYSDTNVSVEADEAESAAGGSSAKETELTEAEIEGLLKINKAVSIDDALEIYNTAFDDDMTSDGLTYSYYKEKYTKDNTYYMYADKKENNGEITFRIDSEGRITFYHHTEYSDDDFEDDNSKKIPYDEALAIGDNIVKKIVPDSYELTDGEINLYHSNSASTEVKYYIKRNNIISFDEYVDIDINNDGSILNIYVFYYDAAFEDCTLQPDLTADEAFDNIVEKVGFKPYYFVRKTYTENTGKITYDTIAAYSFGQYAVIDANTGTIYNVYDAPIDKDSVKQYTDLTDQWYAEAAQNLAYMGYAYSENEFNGDEPLTYSAMAELYSSLLPDDINMEDNVTRYAFASALVDVMGYTEISQYNEIYNSPFEDVEYKYTGAISILKAKEIITGTAFRGNDFITRGEAAVMLYRFLIS